MAVWSFTNTVEVLENKRIDGEFFHPSYIEAEEAVNKLSSVTPLGHLGKFIIGPFGSAFHVSNYDPNSTYRYVRGKDVKPFSLLDDDNVYMPEKDFLRLSRYSLQTGDLLISVVGTLENVAIVPDNLEGIFSCKSTVFRNSKVDPYFLLAYFNSSYGRKCLLRRQRGAVQTGLNKDDLKTVPVPLFGEDLEKNIGDKVKKSLMLVEESKSLYTQATQLLEEALGLDKLEFKKAKFYTASFSEVVSSHRLDAEHFTPLFDQLKDILSAKQNVNPLLYLLEYNKRGKQPTYVENGLPVLNSKHIRVNQINWSASTRFAASPELPHLKINYGDVLLNGTGVGTIGRSAPYLEDISSLPDNHVTILRSSQLDPCYLSVYLNSQAGHIQVNKYLRGSSGQIELYPNDIAKFLIWEAPKELQKEIGDMVREAYEKEKESKQLLEQAKMEVEYLIEAAARSST